MTSLQKITDQKLSLLLFGLAIFISLKSTAQLQWVPVEGCNMPEQTTLKGGFENGGDLSICRVRYEGGLHTGKVVGCGCHFGYGGVACIATKYDVLIGEAEVRWVDISEDNEGIDLMKAGTYAVSGLEFEVLKDVYELPEPETYYAFQGGYENDFSPLLICNGIFYQEGEDKGRHPGKVVNGCCNFGYEITERSQCEALRIMVVKGQVR